MNEKEFRSWLAKNIEKIIYNKNKVEIKFKIFSFIK